MENIFFPQYVWGLGLWKFKTWRSGLGELSFGGVVFLVFVVLVFVFMGFRVYRTSFGLGFRYKIWRRSFPVMQGLRSSASTVSVSSDLLWGLEN